MIDLKLVIFSIIQGIAEFLPISSSGHLVVSQWAFGDKPSLDLNIFLHAGTLLSILVFYYRRIWDLLSKDSRVMLLLIVGTIPAGIFGVIVKKGFDGVLESGLESPLLAGLMFPVTAIVLLWSSKHSQAEGDYQSMSYKTALLIGFAQAFALLPGISRSGMTIALGLFLGLKRESAATFSFLMAIPIILGSMVFEVKDMIDDGLDMDRVATLSLGAMISFVVGLAALFGLVKLVQNGKLHLFAYWLFPLSAIVCGTIFWQMAFGS